MNKKRIAKVFYVKDDIEETKLNELNSEIDEQ